MSSDLRTIHDKLLHIVHLVCSDIRRLSQTALTKQIYDMADAIEFVPQVLINWRPEALSTIRWVLVNLQGKYPDLGVKYTRILDMDDVEFFNSYVRVPPDEE
ncbi:hypothetical protein [Tuwongella immobilis]|uniref:Uncharacterized protein n=1 Tax=Tuwongella immobilis TaxID=692036 RepID=A0A6C2YLP0_9BACT|nr:hypothetical protein [Tuwongella immobilis]VIP01832.1 unnamed protein product [Tuwongella immobilis]VTR99584.1 unnamed protein product [Tuwongella immobilis]